MRDMILYIVLLAQKPTLFLNKTHILKKYNLQ